VGREAGDASDECRTCAVSSSSGSARLSHPQRSAVAASTSIPPSTISRPDRGRRGGQALGAGAAGDDPERDLHLVEAEPVEGAEAEVARRRQLRTAAADPSGDLATPSPSAWSDKLAQALNRCSSVGRTAGWSDGDG
jgi:hypothetical protein